MKKLFLNKIIPFFLIVSIITPALFFGLPTKKAEAIVPVIDAATQAVITATTAVQTAAIIAGRAATDTAMEAYRTGIKWLDRLLAIAAQLFMRALIMTLTQSIVNWINSGFQGSPSFMTNPQGFLANVADRTIGEFIMGEKELRFLCDPFKLQVKLNLGMQYSYGTDLGCTLTGVLGNIQNAYDDFVGGNFIGGGGWDSWMQMSGNPQNTPQGASMMAEGLLQVKLDTAVETSDKEANWGGGSLSLKKCKEATFEVKQDSSAAGGKSRTLMGARTFVGHPGYATGTSIAATHASEVNSTGGNSIIDQEVETTCDTTTPGAVIMDTMKLTESSWIRTLELGTTVENSINAIIGAFATLAVKVTLGKVMSGIFGGDKEDTDYRGQMLQQLDAAKNDPANDMYRGIEVKTGVVDNAIDFETVNLENYAIALETFNGVKSALARSIKCKDLTTDLVRANVLDNIDGIANSMRTKPDVYFNIPYINALASTSKAKLKELKVIRETIINLGALNASERAIITLSEVQGATTTATTTTVEMLNSRVNSVMVGSQSSSNLNRDIATWLEAEFINPKTRYAESACLKDVEVNMTEAMAQQNASTSVPRTSETTNPAQGDPNLLLKYAN
jgi:hypothetical protein